VLRQALVQPRAVGAEEFEDATVFVQDAAEQCAGFPAK
jgi:hypothetical protein